MKRSMFIAFTLLMLGGFVLNGCSSSEEAGDDAQQEAQEEFKSTDNGPDVIPAGEKPVKEAQELPPTEKNVTTPGDEPVTEPQQEEKETVQPGQQQRTGLMMWSVQLGAFKAESGALQLINEAKKKFNQPVYKDYDPVSGFYKVNIGSFPKREQATQFKTEVQSNGYPDAFTVEVRR